MTPTKNELDIKIIHDHVIVLLKALIKLEKNIANQKPCYVSLIKLTQNPNKYLLNVTKDKYKILEKAQSLVDLQQSFIKLIELKSNSDENNLNLNIDAYTFELCSKAVNLFQETTKHIKNTTLNLHIKVLLSKKANNKNLSKS